MITSDRGTIIEQLYGIADSSMPLSDESRNAIVKAAILLAADAASPASGERITHIDSAYPIDTAVGLLRKYAAGRLASVAKDHEQWERDYLAASPASGGETNDTRDIGAIATALSLFVYVIKSSNVWSEECARANDAAFSAMGRIAPKVLTSLRAGESS